MLTIHDAFEAMSSKSTPTTAQDIVATRARSACGEAIGRMKVHEMTRLCREDYKFRESEMMPALVFGGPVQVVVDQTDMGRPDGTLLFDHIFSRWTRWHLR